ncbi:MAG: hypothetical protein ACOC1U_10905 [Spirochaetota bacterium]
MSTMHRLRRIAVAAFMVVAAGLAAQPYPGVYDAVSPVPRRGPVRVFVMPDGSGYRFMMAGGDDFRFECTPVAGNEYECAGEISFTARFDDGGDELVVITDAFGPDASPIRAPLHASGDSVEVNEYRGFVDEDWAYLQVLTTPTQDNIAMRWFLGEVLLDTPVAVASDGALEGEADGVSFSLVVEGDRAMFSAPGSGLPDTVYARVLESRADAPVLTADVGPRFDDYSVSGDLASAFESWYSASLPPSAGASARTLAVVSRIELDAGDGVLSDLSPGGTLLISHVPSSARVTVLESTTGANVASFELERPLDGPPHFAWSPDDSEIAMGLDAGFFGGDREERIDIFRLSPADGSVANLTGDEQVSSDSIASGPRTLDLAPTWVGSRNLVFERRSERDVIIAELDLESRTVTKGADLPAEPGFPLASVFSFAPMTGELFSDFEVAWGEDDGVRAIGPEARRVRMDLETGYPLSVQLSAATFDGRSLLLVPNSLARGLPDPDAQPLIYDREMGDLAPLLPGVPGTRQLLGAAFSPDGSKIVYLFSDLGAERDVLAVRDVDDPASETVLVAGMPGYPSQPLVVTGDPGLDWGANDRVLVPFDGHRRALVLTLGRVRE